MRTLARFVSGHRRRLVRRVCQWPPCSRPFYARTDTPGKLLQSELHVRGDERRQPRSPAWPRQGAGVSAVPRDEALRLVRWYRGIAEDYRAAARLYPGHAAWHLRAAKSADEQADEYARGAARAKGAA